MLARVLVVIVCLCVCLRVCLSHAGIASKRLNTGLRKQHHVIAQGRWFSKANIRWWATPFPLKYAHKMTHTFVKNRAFDQYPLIAPQP